MRMGELLLQKINEAETHQDNLFKKEQKRNAIPRKGKTALEGAGELVKLPKQQCEHSTVISYNVELRVT